MSFRKSPEAIARINETWNNKRLSGERIEIGFRSDRDIIASVLPAPLKPAGNDRVTARVTRWMSNYCGSFTMAGLYVDAVHEGVVGEYVLSMIIDTSDAALLIGREGIGEPKKMGSVELFRTENAFVGTAGRYGTRLMNLRVEAGEDVGASVDTGVIYSVKATLALGGGLQDDPLLLAQELTVHSSEKRPGTGSVVLGGSPHDPFDELPVLDVMNASYAISTMGNAHPIGDSFIRAVLNKEDYLPYHYGHLDDWGAHDTLGDLGKLSV